MNEPLERHQSERAANGCATGPSAIGGGECEIGKTLLGPDVGDVGHPNPVRGFNVKLPVESVVDRDRRLAAIIARATFVADLRFDVGQLG